MKRWIPAAAVVAVGVWAVWGLDIEAARLARAGQSLQTLVSEFFPPQFAPFGPLWDGLVETLQMAILATIIGTALSLPLGLLAARNVTAPWLGAPMRLLAAAIRVLPAILWALLAVIVFGPGPLAGVVALGFYTTGFLTKLQSEAIEGIPRDALDAVRAMGAPRWQQAWHVALPEAANALRSQALFMLEYNVRNSSVLGFVAAGGIGVQIVQAYQFFDYDRILAAILLVFATVVVIDQLSYLIRRRYIELEEAPRARWRDILRPATD